MQAAGSSETVLNLYETAWQHFPRDIIFHILSFILSNIPFTGSNDTAHFVVQPLFVWIQDVYRPIFLIGLVDWMSCVQPVTVTYAAYICVCVYMWEREDHFHREMETFIFMYIRASQSLRWGKYSCAVFSKTAHWVAWVVTWMIVEKKQLFLVCRCSALTLSWGEC